MDWNLKITDMAGATPEHSSVIVNFVAAVRYQLKNSTCYVYSDNVQYRFKDAEGNNKIVIPDASINCRTKSRRGNTFTDAPRFVMEVLSPSTEKYDRTEKMELYAQQEIEIIFGNIILIIVQFINLYCFCTPINNPIFLYLLLRI